MVVVGAGPTQTASAPDPIQRPTAMVGVSVVVVVGAVFVVIVVVVEMFVVGTGGKLVSLHSRRSFQCFAHPFRSCAISTSSPKVLVRGASMQILPGRPISYCASTASFTSLGP